MAEPFAVPSRPQRIRGYAFWPRNVQGRRLELVCERQRDVAGWLKFSGAVLWQCSGNALAMLWQLSGNSLAASSWSALAPSGEGKRPMRGTPAGCVRYFRRILPKTRAPERGSTVGSPAVLLKFRETASVREVLFRPPPVIPAHACARTRRTKRRKSRHRLEDRHKQARSHGATLGRMHAHPSRR